MKTVKFDKKIKKKYITQSIYRFKKNNKIIK